MNTTQIDMQLRARRWTRVLPEVYSTGGRATEPIPFIRAVWLWAGPGAVIEGEAALIWQSRLDRTLSQVSVSCGRNLRPPRGAGSIRVRRHVIDDYWVVAGWTVLRFTWWALTQDAERVVQDIRAAIVRLGGR